jgi:hypothetical protein
MRQSVPDRKTIRKEAEPRSGAGDVGMLVIRQPQREILASPHEARLRERLQHHLSDHFPDECSALGVGLEQVVGDGLAKARDYGLRTERDLVKFLNLVVALGLEFDREPWAARVLSRDDRGPTLRINQLYSNALDRLSEPTPAGGGEPGASH